jgi:putative transposase
MKMLLENDVIQWEDGNEERVLWIDRPKNMVVLFRLSNNKDDKDLPEIRNLSDVEDALAFSVAIKLPVDKYARVVSPDSELVQKYGVKRDKAWNMIKDIVLDEPDIYDPKLRGILISELLNKQRKEGKVTVYRYLRKYWRHGKTPNALLPFHEKSGAKDKKREITEEMKKVAAKEGKEIPKRGRKKTITEVKPEIIGVNIDTKTKAIFKKVINNHFLKSTEPSLKDSYEELKVKFYTDANGGLPKNLDFPTFGQFKYFYYQEVYPDIKNVLIKRKGARKYNKDHREVVGSSTQNEQMAPGSVYQVDASKLNVELVNSFDRTKKIGQATIYLVMDVFSRMIKGSYIGLNETSWETAKLALLDAFTNKETGEEGMRSLFYIPRNIVADRGAEWKGYNSDNLAEIGIHVTNTPSYRADLKGVVEQQFRVLKSHLLNLPGATKKGQKEVGKKDPKLDAVLTIQEIQALVDEIIEDHNVYKPMEQYKRTQGMVRDNVDPYPVDIWNWGIKENNALRFMDRDLVIINLLPKYEAIVNTSGIRIKNNYYTCDVADQEQWLVKAGYSGSKKLTVAVTGAIDVAYLILDDGKKVVPCTLHEREKRYSGYRIEEIDNYFEEEKLHHSFLQVEREQTKTDLTIKKKTITEAATKKTKNALASKGVMSKKDQTSNRKENRKLEKEFLHQQETNKKASTAVETEEEEMTDYSEYEEKLNPPTSQHMSIYQKLKDRRKGTS